MAETTTHTAADTPTAPETTATTTAMTTPTSQDDASPDRALRADARRNRARVLAAAQEAFAQDGPGIPIDEIARRAKVGVGTVYRHFPTKEALLQEIVRLRIDAMLQVARDSLGHADAGAAFFDFFAATAERAANNKALIATLTRAGVELEATTAELGGEFLTALGNLLDRAQRAGAVRADLTTPEVKALLTGCLAMEQDHSTQVDLPRMVGIICDAMRPRN